MGGVKQKKKERCNCPFYLLPILCLIHFITKKSFSFSPSQSICPMSLQILFKVVFISNLLSFSLSLLPFPFSLSLSLWGRLFFVFTNERDSLKNMSHKKFECHFFPEILWKRCQYEKMNFVVYCSNVSRL